LGSPAAKTIPSVEDPASSRMRTTASQSGAGALGGCSPLPTTAHSRASALKVESRASI
jgi:hypothetical protein